jgi:hypothetical protein
MIPAQPESANSIWLMWGNAGIANSNQPPTAFLKFEAY